MKRFSGKALAIFKCAEFEQSGLQKYEQPTKVFCLIENLGEYFSEIKSPSNLKKFCHFERRDAHGSINLPRHTSSAKIIIDHMQQLFDRVTDPALLVRKITIGANHILNESDVPEEVQEQPDLFANHEALEKQKAAEDAELAKERRLQDALLSIKKQFGKNAVLKAMSLQEGATAKDRNQQVGGHKA